MPDLGVGNVYYHQWEPLKCLEQGSDKQIMLSWLSSKNSAFEETQNIDCGEGMGGGEGRDGSVRRLLQWFERVEKEHLVEIDRW